MAGFRFRLGEEDRATYGGPEWVEFDVQNVANLDTEVLEAWEDATGWTFLGTFPAALDTLATKAMRSAYYLALRRAGADVEWSTFRPRMGDVVMEVIGAPADAGSGADAVPPGNRAARRTRSAATKRTTPRSGT